MQRNIYGTPIPEDSQFIETRSRQRTLMGGDETLRTQALQLQMAAETYGYGYQHEWCGVPVIRLPDDIVLLQEMIWSLRPAFVIETGVARGGGLILSASLMAIAETQPRVLGLDIQILEHTRQAILASAYSNSIEIWEGDSSGPDAAEVVFDFVRRSPKSNPGVLFLDSDHSHEHVLRELNVITPLLPVGSIVVVADTLVEEMPPNHYSDRPWDRGNNPMTAVMEFLDNNSKFIQCKRWARRGLITEIRDGILEKISD